MVKRIIKKKKGFTLIELLVVIAIIIILAAILLPYIINRVEDSRISRMIGEIRSLKTAALLYYNDLGIFPVRWDALFQNNPADPTSPNPNWKGPYIEKVPTNLANANSTNDKWNDSSPWRTPLVLVTHYSSAGFQFANQTGSTYNFFKGVALVVENPLISGGNAIAASSLAKIDLELDDGNADSGLIVGANGVPPTLTFNRVPYTTNNASLVVLLQGLK